MNALRGSLFLAAAAFALLLPAPRGRSQQPLPADPLAAIQGLSTANDDLIKRQEATLKELREMTDISNEIRIYSKRG